MSPWLPWLAAAGAAALASSVFVRVLLPVLARRAVLDVPVERSLHDSPVPRGGGLAVLGGALVGVLLAAVVGLPGGLTAREVGVSGALLALVPVTVLAAVGFADDLRSVSAGPRLLLQVLVGTAIGCGLVAWLDASWVWVPLVLVLTVLLVNVTNFMDGANGLTSGHAVVAGLWYAAAAAGTDLPGAVVLALAVAGASAGFVPSNAPVASIFLGDVGSYALGATWAVLASWLVLGGARVDVVLAPLAVLLADAGTTLVRRLAVGDRVTQPHRLHVYQRLVRGGWSHVRVASLVMGVTVVICLLSVPSLLGAPLVVRMVSGVLTALLLAGYLALPARVGPAARWRTVREASR
ncbi:UDP-phosphate glycosyltransferase [Phycicoccus sp. CSK15P-2]|uniref:UDP-phosphate glycosyltransferase n=1 Tax=Phycicoccus sp. CSK15P-2 TaxID=2807627 RepID=UPI00194E3AAC|nr:UDP-phosphate glycosyltransferase [Phycicoccus sp. CSK15P-2]MBM6403494.1 UDP-phosphate glycosyltransferase [Phycicoccus sp. CSK15P-2]